jgi:hypothetical protein
MAGSPLDFLKGKPVHPAFDDTKLDGMRGERGGFWPVGVLRKEELRPQPAADAAPSIVEIEAVNDNVTVDPKSGAVITIEDDGSLLIDTNPTASAKPRESKFNDNLAEVLGESELSHISMKVLDGIQQDEMSRTEWLNDRAQGLRILGIKLEGPRTSIDTTAALEGMSNIRHPMLLEALLNFWANASGEFLPAAGPVKMDDKLKETGESNKLAEKLEEDFNYYLTTVATEYYPDTSRMLLLLGFGGCTFKKVYNCPIRQRPVSESIDAVDLIVSNAATDLRNSGRYTHQIKMRPSVVRRMQLAGAYRDVALTAPSGVVPNAVDQQIATIQGVNLINQQTEDREHTIYECYTELDIPGFEDRRDGKDTGLPLPYRVVVDKDSQQVLEVRRNWAEDDETKTAKVPFVVYNFIPGFGFYGIGLLHILGNVANSMTAAWRETLDAGMFANFPGFLYSKLMGRQNSNEFRVPPGGGVPVEHQGDDIRQAVMPLPYKDVSAAFVQFQDKIAEQGQRLGGISQVQVAEGRQDAPVGTTLAMLEQATKVEKAVHKEGWRSQAQEFMLLKDCFREDPQSFVRAIKKRGKTDWDEQSFMEALDDASLIPQADPNTPSHMHRLIKAQGLIQLDKAYPGVMDPITVVERAVTILGFGDFEALRNKNPQPGGIPPELIAEMKKLELEGQKLADKSTDRAFKLQMETLRGQLAQFEAMENQRKREHDAQMMIQKTRDLISTHQAEAQQHQVEQEMQDQESEDQRADREAQVRVAELAVEEARVQGNADIESERLRHKTEDTKGRHAVAAARAKPKPKPAAK